MFHNGFGRIEAMKKISDYFVIGSLLFTVAVLWYAVQDNNKKLKYWQEEARYWHEMALKSQALSRENAEIMHKYEKMTDDALALARKCAQGNTATTRID